MAKRFGYVALSCLLLVCGAAQADVKIPAIHRIKNRPPGRCGWCALETLARYHGLAALYGLTEAHASRCSPKDLKAVLAKAGISYQIQYPGARDRGILRYAVRHELGAAVGFYEAVPGEGGHIVTLVDFGKDGVKVIDPNDPDGRVRSMTLDQFLYWWDGFALVLEVPATEDRSALTQAAAPAP
jgi:ABC-type bacteriocin/lantibiotic exporter with double-glycine peptidase domain